VSEARLALVIGNSAYSSSPLRNPGNDARAIAGALRGLGFEVMEYLDVSEKAMRRAIFEFGSRLKAGGVGLFYYAGHGIQVQGRNYLISVDADIKSEAEIEVEGMDVAKVLARMETARTRVNIVILDACRNNPFARSFRSAGQGLASIDAPAGTLLAYATAPGRVAADGAGNHGLYTGELLKAMQLPGLNIEQMFKRVRQGVQQHTRGEQVPWESSSLTGDFIFSAVAPASQAKEELARPAVRDEPRPGVGSLAVTEIQRLVEQRLREQGFNLRVEVGPEGSVTLLGVVENAQSKERATSIAAGISGVRHVKDGIFIAPSSAPRRIR